MWWNTSWEGECSAFVVLRQECSLANASSMARFAVYFCVVPASLSSLSPVSPSSGLVPPSLLPALLSLALTISRGAPGTASSLLVEAVEVAAVKIVKARVAAETAKLVMQLVVVIWGVPCVSAKGLIVPAVGVPSTVSLLRVPLSRPVVKVVESRVSALSQAVAFWCMSIASVVPASSPAVACCSMSPASLVPASSPAVASCCVLPIAIAWWRVLTLDLLC